MLAKGRRRVSHHGAMRIKSYYRALRPYVSAAAVIATATVLVLTIFFTAFDLQWIAFLAGVLIASILALASRASRAEWQVARRSAKLASAQKALERETRLRQKFEEAYTASHERSQLLDEVFPVMVAYVDSDGRFRYHNKAYRNWLDVSTPEKIDGRPVRDVLGPGVYAEIKKATERVLKGDTVLYERTHQMRNGAIYRLSVQLVPRFGADGTVCGYFTVLTDVTQHKHVQAAARGTASGKQPVKPGAAAVDSARKAPSEQDLFIDSFTQQVTGEKDAAQRIVAAIEDGEFALFVQRIMALASHDGEPDHFEILIRLREEEESLMVPGAFFPLAEKFGLLPRLDRWVLQHVVEWTASRKADASARTNSKFFVNLAGATLSDPEFPSFVQNELQRNGVPGSAVCFEIAECDLPSRRGDVEHFVGQVRQLGCQIAISGFGRDRVSLDLLDSLPVNFLKIDGSIILDILRDPVALAKVKAINRVAKGIGIKTIAELVESDQTIARLRDFQVDYAQGFGISRPQPLTKLALAETG